MSNLRLDSASSRTSISATPAETTDVASVSFPELTTPTESPTDTLPGHPRDDVNIVPVSRSEHEVKLISMNTPEEDLLERVQEMEQSIFEKTGVKFDLASLMVGGIGVNDPAASAVIRLLDKVANPEGDTEVARQINQGRDLALATMQLSRLLESVELRQAKTPAERQAIVDKVRHQFKHALADQRVSIPGGQLRLEPFGRILDNYINDKADSDQRINDLANTLQNLAQGKFDLNKDGRTLFEFGLDNREAIEDIIEDVAPGLESDAQRAIRKLGHASLKKLTSVSDEATRYAWRLITDSEALLQLAESGTASAPELLEAAVSPTAHVVDFMKTVMPGLIERVGGEEAGKMAESMLSLAGLDNFNQNQLKNFVNMFHPDAARRTDVGLATEGLMQFIQSRHALLKTQMADNPQFAALVQKHFPDPEAFLTKVAEDGLNLTAKVLEQVNQGATFVTDVVQSAHRQLKATRFPRLTPPAEMPFPESAKRIIDVPPAPEPPRVTPEPPRATPEPPRTAPEPPRTTPDPSVVTPKPVSSPVTEAPNVIDDALKRLGLDDESADQARHMLKSLGPESQQRMVKMLENAPHGAMRRGMVKVFGSMDETILSRLAANDTLLTNASKVLGEMSGLLQKFGVNGLEAMAKTPRLFGQAIFKAIPAIGGVASAIDTARMASIASDNSVNPDIRAMALLGTYINGADTALAVTEVLGVGNVAMPAQLGLAGMGLAVSIMVELNKEQGLPPAMSKAVRRASAVMAATGMASPGTALGISAPLANIYGTDVLKEELLDMGRESYDHISRAVSQTGEKVKGSLINWYKTQAQPGAEMLGRLIRNNPGHELASRALGALRQMDPNIAMNQFKTLLNTPNLHQKAAESVLYTVSEMYKQTAMPEAMALLEEQWNQGQTYVFGRMQDLAKNADSIAQQTGIKAGELKSYIAQQTLDVVAKMQRVPAHAAAYRQHAHQALQNMGQDALNAMNNHFAQGKELSDELAATLAITTRKIWAKGNQVSQQLQQEAANTLYYMMDTYQHAADQALYSFNKMGEDGYRMLQGVINSGSTHARTALSALRGHYKELEALGNAIYHAPVQDMVMNRLNEMGKAADAKAREARLLVGQIIARGGNEAVALLSKVRSSAGWGVEKTTELLNQVVHEAQKLGNQASGTASWAMSQLSEMAQQGHAVATRKLGELTSWAVENGHAWSQNAVQYLEQVAAYAPHPQEAIQALGNVYQRASNTVSNVANDTQRRIQNTIQSFSQGRIPGSSAVQRVNRELQNVAQQALGWLGF